MFGVTYSIPLIGLEASKGAGRGGEDCIVTSSSGVDFGVGDWTSICAKYGCLCGRGDMSIRSCKGPGEDDSKGGVVAHSTHC